MYPQSRKASSLNTFLPSLGRTNTDTNASSANFKTAAFDKIIINYTGVPASKIHSHANCKRRIPHIHKQNDNRCVSAISGYDSHRLKRYYFTKEQTVARVYLTYGGIAGTCQTFIDELQDTVPEGPSLPPILKNNVQRLSMQEIKDLKVSKKFLKDASSMNYNKATRSFVPIIYERSQSIRPASRASLFHDAD